MAKFEERVLEIINDRVNDLEKLFHETEISNAGPHENDCCEDIQRKVNEIRHITDKILRDVESLRPNVEIDNSINLGDIILQPEGSDGAEDAPWEKPDWMDTGIPRTLKDILEVIGGILGGTLAVKSWPAFLRWLGRMLPFLLKNVSVIPLIGLVATLWRGIMSNIDNSMLLNSLKELKSELNRMMGREDELFKLLNEMATGYQPGGDSSMILDRLQDLQDKLNLYYQSIYGDLANLSTMTRDGFAAIQDKLAQQESLMVMTRSDVACVAEWLKGQRSCEELDTDIISLLNGAKECCLYVKCHLDEYYNIIIQKLEDEAASLHSRLNDCEEQLGRIYSRINGPDNPLDSIGESVERGNVVGTGSLILNYANDLNIIKSMISDVRRCL